MLRHPSWCPTATVRVNGTEVARSGQPGSYVAVNRRWRNGDRIAIELPMAMTAVPLPSVAGIVAFTYGPILLAGDGGNGGIAPGADLIVNERRYGSVLDRPFHPPTLLGDPARLAGRAGPAGTPLHFLLPKAAGEEDLRLSPYFSLAHRRYVTYWNVARDGS